LFCSTRDKFAGTISCQGVVVQISLLIKIKTKFLLAKKQGVVRYQKNKQSYAIRYNIKKKN
jgi:hypothetical protein